LIEEIKGMRSFFSTPLFRLLVVIINCSLLFPVVGIGFGSANFSFSGESYGFQADSAPHRLGSFQLKHFERLGILPNKQGNPKKQSVEKQKQQTQDKESGGNVENGVTQDNSVRSDTKTTTETKSVAATQNKTQKDNASDVTATTEKNKLSNRKSFSAVKNLPDAEKLRTQAAQMPQIPAPIPSTACLINTINCPSDKNREVAGNSPKGNGQADNLLSSIIPSYSAFSAKNYLFSNLLAFNNKNPLLSAKVSSKETKSATATDVSQGHNFFSNVEMYNPSAPASYTASTNALMLPPGGNGKIFDFDGDNKADMSFWRPDTGAWFVLRSSDSSLMTQTNFGLGSSGDRIVPGNYDGDTKTDYAYWRASTGVWTIKQSSNNQTVTYTLGQSGDLPVQGDYDGDGKTDVAVWRPSNGTWYYRKSLDGTTQYYNWGLSADVPVVGDFDGDNKTDFTIVRPSDANWYIMQSSNGWLQIQWGAIGDRLVPGDYDGDGKTDLGVWRASDNTWYIRKSTTGTMQALTWGISADYPVPADYDGDGKTDFAIWRNLSGEWWITQSSNGYQYATTFGATGDIPVPVSYVAYFSASNQTPTAEAGGPYNAATGTAVRFDGRGSTDADGQVYGYNWNFGDGSTGAGSRPSHAYSTAGTYTVSLTITDNRGAVSAADTATVTVINSTEARLDPFNAVGGTDVISKNFSWGTGLAGLPGRGGLGAGLGLSYNSLVWLKQGSYMIFDPDNGFPGPGFRLGMANIERRHYNPQTGKNGFLMLTGSGSRVEFRQIGASSTYETADSGYSQLIDYGTSLLVRTTDGTQYTYEPIGQGYECIKIKDRNGNFIEAAYNSSGRLTQITDTLGRALVVNYDENGNPLSIAQSYNGAQPRVYATFGYELRQINTSFSGLTVIGPANNSQITVLKQVAFNDGSYYRFTYNSYGQIYQIDQHAKDGHKLNHVKYSNLESPGTQSDCPRFTSREDYAENWMTVTTQYPASATANWTMPDDSQPESGLMSKVIAPDGTESRYFYHSTGWDKAVPRLVETWGADKPGDPLERQRWSTVRLTQNNTGISYIENPRVTSSAVGDAGSTRKSSVNYTTYSLPSGTVMYLPNDSFEYEANGTTVYRHVQTDYNFNPEYALNRYIIGLVSETRLYAGAGTGSLQAKTTIGYDEEALTNLSGIIKHDTTNYSTGLQWRGNPTSIKRWDVINTTQSTVNKIGYTIAGTPAWTQSPTQTTTNRVSISYTDNFSNAADNRNSYAYPTTVTDPDNYTATSKYHYLTGLIDTAQGPKAGQISNSVRGAISKTHYDSIDRVQKAETLYSNGTATGAYIRYEYPDSMIEAKSYTKLDGSLAEAYSLAVLDGHGRTRATAAELPNSPSNGYSGRIFEYDNMGRNWKSSMPTETSASGTPSGWQATGDDSPTNQPVAGHGWLYTTETFDWKGRPVVSTNTDGTNRLYSYDGCGCAGNQVTTVKSEQVNGTSRRTQKIHQDWLGRTSKTEVMHWDGTTPYTTTVNAFNTRDQVTMITQYAGAQGGSPSQNVTMTYDGYGRMKTRRYPVEDPTTYTSWDYYTDGSVQKITDPRGATSNFSYNWRGLVTNVSYTSPNTAQIPDAQSVAFTYDAAGNRTQMDDGPGAVNYSYNELSQMTSETRLFDALPGNSFGIGYVYYAGGGLQSITDPFNSTVSYTNDKTGRLTAVAGTPFGNNTSGNYADQIKYRAFGAIKQMNYKTDDNALVSMQYDNRLRVSQHQVATNPQTNEFLKKATFEYFADSRPKAMDNVLDAGFDRSFAYDFAGRLSSNAFGTALDGQGNQVTPYSQTIVYDAFSQMTSRETQQWGTDYNFYRSYQNGRQTAQSGETLTFDAAGNITYQGMGTNKFQQTSVDAAGRAAVFVERWQTNGTNPPIVTEQTITRSYDGGGEAVTGTVLRQRVGSPPATASTTYQIYSSVLGSIITEMDGSGQKITTKVFAGGAVIAEQQTLANNVVWYHADPVTGSKQTVVKSGAVASTIKAREEYEPLGQSVRLSAPVVVDPPSGQPLPPIINDSLFPEWQCMLPTELMPSHCGLKILADGSKYFGKGGDDKTEGNVSKLTDSPLPDFYNNSESNKMMAFTLSATNKPDKKKKKKSGWGAGSIGEFVVDVEKPMIDVTDTGMVDASQSGDVIYGEPFKVPRDFMPVVSQVVNGFLDKNPKCEQFVNSLLTQLSKDTGLKLEGDIRYFIKEFEKKGNLNITPISSPSGANLSGGGEFDSKNHYGSANWGFSMRLSNKWFDRTLAANVSTFLHEFIHAIGARVNPNYSFDDYAAATAVYNMGLMKMSPDEYYNLPEIAKKLEEIRKNSQSGKAIASDYWRGTLDYHCGRNITPSNLMKR
jgi:YD repeat-containing protein